MTSFFNILIFCLLSINVFSQELEYTFAGSQNENEIYLNWVIAKGSTCNGVDIERSYDSTQFERIGSIFGVCGSADFPQPYNFSDIRPIPNSINYYRLVFGGREYSNVLPIYFISYNNFGYSVNNSSTNTTIYFLNNVIQKLKFVLADMSGRILSETDEVSNNKVEIDNNNLHHGFYVFVLMDERGNKLQRGKIFID